MSSCECGSENKQILQAISRMDDKLDQVSLDVAVMKGKVDLVHKTVIEGNGKPALVTRVELLESDTESRTESTKGKYMVWGALITGILSLIGLIFTNLNREPRAQQAAQQPAAAVQQAQPTVQNSNRQGQHP